MARRITIQCAVICALALSFGVFSVVGVGVGVAESNTNETEIPTITTSGEGEDIFSNKNKTTLKNVSIKHPKKYNNRSNINVFISMSELEEENIKTNSSKIGIHNISGASVSNIGKLNHQGHTIFKVQVKLNNKTEYVHLNEIDFTGIGTSDISSTTNVQYKLGASVNKSGRDYPDLKKDDQIKKSEPFNIVTNSVRAPDQATISSKILDDSPTSAGITIRNFVSDVDSAILITQGYNGTRLAGFGTQSATSVYGRQNISVRLDLIGGKKRIHVIPKSDINISEYKSGDYISESTLESAIATDRVHIYSGIIEFSDQKYNNSVESNLTIKKSELLDLNGDNTPYLVSIHPMTSDGRIVSNSTYGHSEKLTGTNENISIDLRSPNSTNTGLFTSNQLAATLQIYERYTAESANGSDSTYILPNSDVNDQFVNGGISDTARIKIEVDAKSRDEIVHVDHQYIRNNTSANIYSGHTIIVNNTLLENNSKKLFRIDGNQNIISAVGDSITNTSYTEFSTRGLQTGWYTFNRSGSVSEDSFRIIGSKDQYTNIHNISEQLTNIGIIPLNIQHNSPKTKIVITRKDTNTTAATIRLATPEKGQTTVELNTYAAANGSLNESVTVAGPGSSIESVTTPGGTGTLSPGAYEIAVRSEQGIATTSDNATMTLTRRSTNELTTYAGTETKRSDLGSAAAVRDTIESGTLSRSDGVDGNDTVVYAVNASGLTGLPAARNATPETGDGLDSFDGLEFGVRSTGGEGGLTGDDALGETPRDSTVHVDGTGLYVVADGADAFPIDGEPEPGEEFTAEFRVTDDRLREVASDPPDDHRVTSTVTFAGADRDGSTGDARERSASGGPVAGSGGGTENDGGVSGGGSGVGGGGADGTTPGDPSGGDRPEETNGGSAPGGGGNGDRIGPARGAGFGTPPNAERRTPHLNRPIAVSVPAAVGGIEPSESSETPGGGTGSDDSGEVDTGTADTGTADTENSGGGPEGASGETGSSEPGAAGSERATPTYENAPIRTTAEDIPGFGPLQSLAALTVTLLAATRGRWVR